MKTVTLVFACVLAVAQVLTGLYLSLDNSTGWVFPILTGLGTLTVAHLAE